MKEIPMILHHLYRLTKRKEDNSSVGLYYLTADDGFINAESWDWVKIPNLTFLGSTLDEDLGDPLYHEYYLDLTL